MEGWAEGIERAEASSARSTGPRGFWSAPSSSARWPTSGSPTGWLFIRVSRLAAAATLAVMALMGCQPVATAPKPARGGTAVEALVGAPGALNPLFEVDATTRDVDSVIYQGLTTVDAQQNVIGQLASTWTISPNHLSYTFTIRD